MCISVYIYIYIYTIIIQRPIPGPAPRLPEPPPPSPPLNFARAQQGPSTPHPKLQWGRESDCRFRPGPSKPNIGR